MVTSNNVITQNRKYEYLSQPLYSTNITFMIRDINLDDAGYYTGGINADDAWSGDGVVLIVLGESILGLLLIKVDLILSFHFHLLPDNMFCCEHQQTFSACIFFTLFFYRII